MQVRSRMNPAGFLLVLVLGTAGFSTRGYALATEQVGPDSADRPTVAQPGWPSGIVELTRHPSRVYSVWVNGNERFYFEAVPREIDRLLTLFSQSRMRDHAVRVLPGAGTVSSFDRQTIGYNVSLQVLTGIALAHAREQSQPWGGAGVQLEPTLTIHSGQGEDLLRQLSWPTNVIVDCQVPALSLQSPKTRPIRERFHGRLVFVDGSSAEGFVRNVATRITLWDGGDQPGIGLTEADRDGRFTVGFSSEEIADLQAGRTWLTVTIGNWLTEPRPTDQRLPFDRLAPDSDQAKSLEIGAPPSYHGRILFDNGEPPVLKPEPWPGARIMVDFPYAGSSEPDGDGYFQVVLSSGQLENLLAQKPRKNVYIPSYTERGSSTARFVFPPSLLAEHKTNAGVLKIPRPEP